MHLGRFTRKKAFRLEFRSSYNFNGMEGKGESKEEYVCRGHSRITLLGAVGNIDRSSLVFREFPLEPLQLSCKVSQSGGD